MHQIFTKTAYATNPLCCSHCDWQGQGNEAEQEDLYLTDAVELYCPSCHHYIGFVNSNEED